MGKGHSRKGVRTEKHARAGAAKCQASYPRIFQSYPPSCAPDVNLLPSTTQACKCPVFSLYSANTCHYSKFSPFSRHHEQSECMQCCIVLGAQIVGVHIANVLFSSSSPPREPSPFRELNRGDQFSAAAENIFTSIPALAHALPDGQNCQFEGKLRTLYNWS